MDSVDKRASAHPAEGSGGSPPVNFLEFETVRECVWCILSVIRQL